MQKQKQGYQIDMVNGPLAGKILLFAIPLMLSSVLQLMFNAADVVVVGQFAGKEALAAVGSNGSLINLFVNLFIGLSVGTNVVIARDLGAGKTEHVHRSVHTSITLALIGGLILMVAGFALSRQMLELMSSPPDVIDLSTLYLRIYFLGMPGNLLYNFGAAILRAQGDTRRPLYYLSFAGVLNVVLNLVFVIPLKMSVAGVALATIISQYVSAALVLRALMREEGVMHLDLKALSLDWHTVKRILRVGLPAGLQSTLFSISNVVIQSSINSFGSTIVAGSSAAANIEGFIYPCTNAFHQAALTFISQNYGAGKCKRVDRIAILTLSYGAVVSFALGNLIYFFGAPLASLYAPGEPEVIAQAVVRLGYIAVFHFLCAFMDIMVGVLRGLGHSVVPMIVSLIGSCAFRLLWIATIFQTYTTPACLYISYPISWALTAIAHIAFFFAIRKPTYRRAQGFNALN